MTTTHLGLDEEERGKGVYEARGERREGAAAYKSSGEHQVAAVRKSEHRNFSSSREVQGKLRENIFTCRMSASRPGLRRTIAVAHE